MLERLQIINQMNREMARKKGHLYISLREAAKNNDIGLSWIKILLEQGRVEGAYKVDQKWIVPSEWSYTRKHGDAIRPNQNRQQ